MKKKAYIILTILLIILATISGIWYCTANREEQSFDAYTGENKLWKAEIVLNNHASPATLDLSIEYKGIQSDLDNTEKLVFGYTDGHVSGYDTVDNDGLRGKKKFYTSFAKGGTYSYKSPSFQVKIQYGNEEHIIDMN